MILFDSHSHLDDKRYNKDLKAVMERAEAENVRAIMIVGIDLATSQKAIKIAKSYKQVSTSVGIHPHNAKHCSQNILDELIRLTETNDCVKAWGEIGLDFNRMFSPAPDQEACFIAQLEIAGKLNLPLIFHERDSHGRFYEILSKHRPEHCEGVIHCFSGNKEELSKYLDLGYYIGITGIVTIEKRGKKLRKLIPHIPEDRLIIETDAPYLTPYPQKNKYNRNEPAFVKSVLLKLAEIRGQDPESLSEIIFNNTCRLYN